MFKKIRMMIYRRKSVSNISTAIKLMYFSYNFSISLLQPFISTMLRIINFSTFQIGIIIVVGTVGGVGFSLGITDLADRWRMYKSLQNTLSILSVILLTLPIFLLNLKIADRSTEEKAYANIFPNSTGASNISFNVFTGNKAFWFLFCFFSLHTTCDTITKCLMETVVYGTIRDVQEINGIHLIYSNQRIFLNLGNVAAGLITGLMVDVLKTKWPVEYLLISMTILFGLIQTMCLALILPNFSVPTKNESPHSLLDLMKNWDINILLLSNTIINITVGTLKFFEPLYIIELGGSRMLIGICFSVGYLCDIISMKISPVLIAIMGGPGGIVPLGMLFFSARSLFYAFACTPYMALECNIRKGFLLGFLWPTFSNGVHDLAPRPLINKYLSLLFSVGRIGSISGSLLGGILIDRIGFRYTLLVLTGISGIWFLISAFYYAISYYKNKTTRVRR